MIKAKVQGIIFQIEDNAVLIGGDYRIQKVHELAMIRPLHPWEGPVSMVVLNRMKKMLPDDLEILKEVYPVLEKDTVY